MTPEQSPDFAPALLERILRRGKVEIENVVVTTGWTPFVAGEPQHAIQAPAVQVKWWANYERERVDQSRVYWRFGKADRITAWFYNSVFGQTYYETTKPTLAEALADVDEHTRPDWHALDSLVAENEVQKERWQEGVTVVGALTKVLLHV